MMHLTERYNKYFCCKGSFYYSKNNKQLSCSSERSNCGEENQRRARPSGEINTWSLIGVSSDPEQFTKGRRFIFNSREYKVDSSSVIFINLTVDSVMHGGDLYYQLELEGKCTLLHDGSATD